MITLTARIKILSDNGSLSSATSNLSKNNISSNIGHILGTRKRGGTPFILGSSKVGMGDTFSGNVDYFIGKQLSDNNGDFANAYSIVVNGTNITALTIAFDTINNSYPTSIVVDGAEYTDDDSIYTLKLTSSNSHTIVIDNWNKPNSPLIITGIYVDVSIEVDRRNILSLERSVFDRSDLTLPSFGIISNKGSLSFVDVDNEVRDYAEMLLLKQGLSVEIYLNNTIADMHEKIAEYVTDTWTYDNYNKNVEVTLSDGLEVWQDIEIPGKEYYPTVSIRRSAVNIFGDLCNFAPTQDATELLNLDDETRQHLSAITVEYPIVYSGNLWTAFQKFCEAFQCHIYKENGVLKCKYRGGN